jgi:hypothetical protein
LKEPGVIFKRGKNKNGLVARFWNNEAKKEYNDEEKNPLKSIV